MFLYISVGLAAITLLILVIRLGRLPPTHAGGIVIKQEEGRRLVLLVTSSANKEKWVLPKGRIEKKETPEFAAIREVMEETGVSAKPLKKAGTVTYRRKSGRVRIVYFLMAFEAFYNTSTEGRKLAWVEKEKAIKMLGAHSAVKVLKSI
ncbi:MAG TPA: NUDIX domain-containing protein [Chitinophagaceae bacterium]|nr:NUDIX domain-containing protein [Chitinophagaceae bacterium]